MATKFKYPIIGGPLDGEHADYADWYGPHTGHPAGIFFDHATEYVPFNRADGVTRGLHGKRAGGPASLIWLHSDLLHPMIRG